MPPWAWLNALAHRPPDQLRNLTGVGCDQLGEAWADAAIVIVAELRQVGEAAIAEIGATVFIPLELEALAGRDITEPSQLVRVVRRRLVTLRRECRS